MVNRIILNETSYHGAGAVKSIVAELASRNLKKPIVFSDPDLVKFGVTKKVTDLLDEAKVKYALYTDIKANPTIANVKNGVKAAKAAMADSIIAIGGGSSMDTARRSASSSRTRNSPMCVRLRASLPPRIRRSPFSPFRRPRAPRRK